MYSQIQNIPTPILFLKRTEGELNDFLQNANFALDAFESFFAHEVDAGNDSANSVFALQSFITNGKQPTTQSDSFNSPYFLQSFIAVLADSFSTSDAFNSPYALQSFINVAAQQRSESESQPAGYALQSMVV